MWLKLVIYKSCINTILRANRCNTASDGTVDSEVKLSSRRANNTNKDVTLLPKLQRLCRPFFLLRIEMTEFSSFYKYGSVPIFVAFETGRGLSHLKYGNLPERCL